MRPMLAALVLIVMPFAAQAAACETQAFEDIPYTLCRVDAVQDDLRLFLYDDTGTPIGQFGALETLLEKRGQSLVFAMNAGMYHEDRAPVGHYIQDGEQMMRVVPNAGPGNFGLLPNGVLCINDNSIQVIETLRFQETKPQCRDATQSGPMLVIDGALHPRFLPDSTSRYVRNGVGTNRDGTQAIFVISDRPVTFHEFARFFRDSLGLPQALFLDGNVSRLHAPELSRSDFGRWMGPMAAVVAPLPAN